MRGATQSKLPFKCESCRVKLATDLNTQKQVAIKILKVNHLTYSSKEEALLCLQSEVNILHQCSLLKVSNVVKIKDASFDGTLIKEVVCGE